jgi:excisionase family DNA binding protein
VPKSTVQRPSRFSKSLRDILSSPAPRHLLTVEQAATYLNVSVYCIRQIIAAGKLAIIRIGNRFMIDKVDLDNFVNSNKETR